MNDNSFSCIHDIMYLDYIHACEAFVGKSIIPDIKAIQVVIHRYNSEISVVDVYLN